MFRDLVRKYLEANNKRDFITMQAQLMGCRPYEIKAILAMHGATLPKRDVPPVEPARLWRIHRFHELGDYIQALIHNGERIPPDVVEEYNGLKGDKC